MSYHHVPTREYQRLWVAVLAALLDDHHRKILAAVEGQQQLKLTDNTDYAVGTVDLEVRLAKEYFRSKDGRLVLEFSGIGLTPKDLGSFFDKVARGEKSHHRKNFTASRVVA